eukprot:TRINITY_DN10280_c0_g1_i1.p1 TRINITY_DN10280_c0_g1~~TRINITY_DN10280_c0_g1_i1.p1  ORF type:complete len:358 (-),score=80.85 TRINITY_DN10280_c0_g1_i1:26-1099(-)
MLVSRATRRRTSTKISNSPTYESVRYKKLTPPRPKIRVRLDPNTKKITVPEKLPGYTHDQAEKFRLWLKKTSSAVFNDSTLDQRTSLMRTQSFVDSYLAGEYGRVRNLVKMKQKKRKVYNAKRRQWKFTERRLMKWNEIEDMKEDRIIRDMEREEYDDSKQFSFTYFVREQRKKKKPVIKIGTDEEFEEFLEKDKQTHLFKKPMKLRRALNGNENYITLRQRDVEIPWLYEVRRRARVAELVNKREQAIAEKDFEIELAIKREKLRLEKAKKHKLKMAHWQKILGDFYNTKNRIQKLKFEYMNERTEIFKLARKEFLKALSEDVDKWAESPEECRFMRFRFNEGVGDSFPYNNTPYI